jgi:DNA polymerase-3 subunit beta
MCGVHLGTVAKYDALDIVASDGTVMVRNRLTDWTNHSYEGKIDATIPTKVAKILADTLTNDDPILLRFGNGKCQVETDDYTLTCRLIDGTYPKYNSVIPSDNNIEAVVDRSKMKDAVKRVLPFAPDASQMISLHFDSDELRVVSNDFDFNEGADDKVPVEFNSTEPLSIGLKGSTLQKALGYIRNLEVRIKMSDPSRAVLLEPKEQPKTEVTILLMPMLLNE